MKNRAVLGALVLLTVLTFPGCGRFRRHAATQPPTVPAQQPQTRPAASVTIPILCFHDVGANAKPEYSVTTKVFGAYIKYLHSAGYQTVTISQIGAYLAGQGTLPAKPIALTFDDGWKSVVTTVKPILDKYGYTGTAYLIANSVGTGAKSLTWDDAKGLRKCGYEIGSHTLSHAMLTRRGPKETKDAFERRIRKEIADSKSAIEQHLGETISSIAYPNGLYDDFVLETARQEGYSAGCTTDHGPADSQSSALRLPRQMILNKTSMRTFQHACALKAVHLTNVRPEIGAHVAARSASISFDLESGVTPSQILKGIRLSSGSIIHTDVKGQSVSLSVRLNHGASYVIIDGAGRGTSWLVICDGQ